MTQSPHALSHCRSFVLVAPALHHIVRLLSGSRASRRTKTHLSGMMFQEDNNSLLELFPPPQISLGARVYSLLHRRAVPSAQVRYMVS